MNQLLTGTPFALELIHGKHGEASSRLYLTCDDRQKSVIADFCSSSIVTLVLARAPRERGSLINNSDSYYIFCNTSNGSYLLSNMKWSKENSLTPEPQAFTVRTHDESQPSFESYIYFELSNKPEHFIYYRQLYGFRKVTTKKRYHTV